MSASWNHKDKQPLKLQQELAFLQKRMRHQQQQVHTDSAQGQRGHILTDCCLSDAFIQFKKHFAHWTQISACVALGGGGLLSVGRGALASGFTQQGGGSACAWLYIQPPFVAARPQNKHISPVFTRRAVTFAVATERSMSCHSRHDAHLRQKTKTLHNVRLFLLWSLSAPPSLSFPKTCDARKQPIVCEITLRTGSVCNR